MNRPFHLPSSVLRLLSYVFCLLFSVSCRAQTNRQSIIPSGSRIVPSFCPRWYIGEGALDPRDTAATHALQRQLQILPVGQRPFVRMSLDWSAASTGDWSFADSKVTLNSNCNIIVLLGYEGETVPTVSQNSNALVAYIARYTNKIWGVDAYNEPDATLGGTCPNCGLAYVSASSNTSLYASFVTTARYVINHAGYAGKIRLCGPSTANSWIDAYASNLWVLGVLSNLDVIAAHDYFACPGNGGCTNAGPYVHLNTAVGGGIPNLPDRIANMRYWASRAGATNLVILEEYGLYSGDLSDARALPVILATNNCVAILNAPAGPIGACPWENGEPDATWSPAVIALMNWTCTQ